MSRSVRAENKLQVKKGFQQWSGKKWIFNPVITMNLVLPTAGLKARMSPISDRIVCGKLTTRQWRTTHSRILGQHKLDLKC